MAVTASRIPGVALFLWSGLQLLLAKGYEGSVDGLIEKLTHISLLLVQFTADLVGSQQESRLSLHRPHLLARQYVSKGWTSPLGEVGMGFETKGWGKHRVEL